ncbi:hypothetical protein [Salibacterium lacus]|uniref:Uncharacterized protein n=1 Tax=Salibacterium lacus TaxID=1898109 RepID=A0ABW5SXG6_9BACI
MKRKDIKKLAAPIGLIVGALAFSFFGADQTTVKEGVETIIIAATGLAAAFMNPDKKEEQPSEGEGDYESKQQKDVSI